MKLTIIPLSNNQLLVTSPNQIDGYCSCEIYRHWIWQETTIFSEKDVKRAIIVSKVCRESRKTNEYCGCTCCQIAQFVKENKLNERE